jgi:hypothetical protein
VTPRGPAGATLQAALTRMLGGPVGPVRRAPWAYSSSVAIEEVRVPGGPVLLLKEMADRPRPSRPAFLHDPEREPEAYATLPAGLDLPVCHGTLAEGRRTWLVLEQVDGVPLWQREDLAAWEAAARWAARLHALPAVRTPRGLRQDAAHLHRWVDRALAMAPRGALGDVEAAARRAADRLAALPGVRLHGELYPSNVLVGDRPGGPRIRPVDWETAGTGPGVLDLAALIAGDWEPALRERVIAAYRGALGRRPAGFGLALDAARLLVALQWLGWSDSWRPPPEHAHDWAADVRALAGAAAP